MAKSEEELEFLMKVKKDSEKVGLKLIIQDIKIMVSGPITSWQIDGKQWKQWLTLFWGAPKSLQMVTIALKLKYTYLLLGRKSMTNLDSTLESRGFANFANKGPSSQNYDFSSSHVWMWELDYKESWEPKN